MERTSASRSELMRRSARARRTERMLENLSMDLRREGEGSLWRGRWSRQRARYFFRITQQSALGCGVSVP